MEQPTGWTTCVRVGVRDAWQQRGLVILVWALFLAAALLAVVPAWRWWNTTLSLAPEGDRLLDGLNAALMRELTHYDRSPTYAIAFAPLSAFLLAMFVLNPFIAGGILASFSRADARDTAPDARDTLPDARDTAPDARDTPRAPGSWSRFLAAGARHYGVFLRLLLLAIGLGALLGLFFVLLLLPIASYLSKHYWEQPYLIVAAMFPAALTFAWWLTSLLLDVARVRALYVGERRAWRALGGGLRFLRRNALATLAVGVTFALLTALTFAVYFSVSSSVTPKSGLAILLAIVWQQLLSLTRTGLRISMLAAECRLVASREPVSREPVSREPVSREPVVPEPVSREPVSPEPVSREPVSHESVSPEPTSREPATLDREPASRDQEPASRDQEIDGKLTSSSAPPDAPLLASIDPP
jgi:hypothetical protein